jgi:hypothetical protein
MIHSGLNIVLQFELLDVLSVFALTVVRTLSGQDLQATTFDAGQCGAVLSDYAWPRATNTVAVQDPGTLPGSLCTDRDPIHPQS